MWSSVKALQVSAVSLTPLGPVHLTDIWEFAEDQGEGDAEVSDHGLVGDEAAPKVLIPFPPVSNLSKIFPPY